MCGIAGFYCFGETRPTLPQLRILWYAQQSRGTDASGVAYLHEGKIKVRKAPIPAQKLIQGLPKQVWEDIRQSPRALFHARAATQGEAKHNPNNHPVNGYNWAVVHNGIIRNDDDLFTYYKETPFAEVDSAAIPLVLSRGKTIEESIHHLSLLAGEATLAAWPGEYPDYIVLAKLGWNPLFLLADRDIIFWTSSLTAVQGFQVGRVGAVPLVTLGKVESERVLLFTPAGVRTFELKPRPFFMVKALAPRTAPPPILPISTRGASPIRGARLVQYHRQVAVRGKPDIDPSVLKLETFSWNTWRLGPIEHRVESTTVNGIYTLVTVYGRWLFHKSKDGLLLRKFKPCKRIRKFWYQMIQEAPDLPVTHDNRRFDDLLPLESLKAEEYLPGGHVWSAEGYLCPWCGAADTEAFWVPCDFRCRLCGIKSRKPI